VTSFIQLLVSGLATGAIHALVAVGLCADLADLADDLFAQGEFVVLPGFFIVADEVWRAVACVRRIGRSL
jgi:branched-chain amino acid transport system permease protein